MIGLRPKSQILSYRYLGSLQTSSASRGDLRKTHGVRILNKQTNFVTCPIYYATSTPHIGHIHSSVIGDFYHRWNKINDVPSKFSIGTDEHGQKIIRSAAQQGYDHPELLVNNISDLYRRTFKKFSISVASLDDAIYMRTTNPEHHEAAQKLWSRLRSKGHIRIKNYEGWYSTPDESFVGNKEIVEKDGKHFSSVNGHQLEWISEENYIFDFEPFLSEIEAWIEKAVTPDVAKVLIDELKERRNTGNTSLSISRPRKRVPWGVAVPDDPNHTMYVWFEALINYLTAAGYARHENALDFWPPQLQVLGIDIARFHCIYWPAMLLAADLPLPKKVFVHGHWTRNGMKMSKSLDNFVTPKELLELVGNQSDAVRWFCLKHATLKNVDFQDELLRIQSDSDLANKIANLLSRTTSKNLNPSGAYPTLFPDSLLDRPDGEKYLIETVQELPEVYAKFVDQGQLPSAMNCVIRAVEEGLQFMTNEKIFKLDRDIKSERMQKDSAIHACYELLRVSAILLQPAIPQISSKILNRLGIPLENRFYEDAEDSFSGMDGDQFERVGRLLGPNQGHLFKTSALVKKEIEQMAKFEAQELARYDKKHPTRTAPENEIKNTGRKQKERIKQKARAKMAEIKAARDAKKPLDRRQGDMSAEELNMDLHDPNFRAPDFPNRK
ncbi:Oidioi.mRNA.OKI2018_I69.XSR.g15001.t1.cds [Oikopleura dioica]|uniref:Methionine--tRNA ligase, mitochondrial n=1 Tax=Oikopleura dioica TaxID=34765 RepID=A0ABN7SBH0_OIKDI|nr:Oidioi.mRNA.OKI2018_I69.XSR.g15001.t1.cds [Oikopleura dioica]